MTAVVFELVQCNHLSTPLPLPLPLPAVPRAIPLPLGMPLALPAPDVPRVVRDAGAGVEYFEEILDEVGGCSTKDVSFVLLYNESSNSVSFLLLDLHKSCITVTI